MEQSTAHFLPSLTPSLIKLLCGRSLVNSTHSFFKWTKNFVTVDIFMMSVNKKTYYSDFLLSGHFVYSA